MAPGDPQVGLPVVRFQILRRLAGQGLRFRAVAMAQTLRKEAGDLAAAQVQGRGGEVGRRMAGQLHNELSQVGLQGLKPGRGQGRVLGLDGPGLAAPFFPVGVILQQEVPGRQGAVGGGPDGGRQPQSPGRGFGGKSFRSGQSLRGWASYLRFSRMLVSNFSIHWGKCSSSGLSVTIWRKSLACSWIQGCLTKLSMVFSMRSLNSPGRFASAARRVLMKSAMAWRVTSPFSTP